MPVGDNLIEISALGRIGTDVYGDSALADSFQGRWLRFRRFVGMVYISALSPRNQFVFRLPPWPFVSPLIRFSLSSNAAG